MDLTQVWPLIRQRLRRTASFRPLVVGAAALAGGWVCGVASQPSPARIVDVHELDNVAVRGGVLDLKATIDQRRPCVTSVQRWLWRPDPLDAGGIEYAPLPEAPFKPPLTVGRDRYRLRIPVPAYVEDGDWHYLGVPEDACSPFAIWRWFWPGRQSPDVIVHIENPTPGRPAEVVTPPGAVTIVPTDSQPQGGNR